MRLAFCDLETTGFSREKHEIIQLAGIIWDSVKDEVVDTFNEFIKPNGRIPAEITVITGISNSMVLNARKSWEVLPDFYAWLKANRVEMIVGHNFKAFDQHFLIAQVARYNLASQYGINPEAYPIIDTMTIARQLMKSGRIQVTNVKQPTLAAYFGIEYEAHNAIEDVAALLEIYKRFRKLDLNLK